MLKLFTVQYKKSGNKNNRNNRKQQETHTHTHSKRVSRSLQGSPYRLPSKPQIKDDTKMQQHFYEKKKKKPTLGFSSVSSSCLIPSWGGKKNLSEQVSILPENIISSLCQNRWRHVLFVLFSRVSCKALLATAARGERERKRLPWGEELPRASESLFTTSCACYFHQNRAQSFSSPLVFLCFWQEVVIVKHQVPLCLTEQWN